MVDIVVLKNVRLTFWIATIVVIIPLCMERKKKKSKVVVKIESLVKIK